MTDTQPSLFPLPAPQPPSTDALLRRLADHEAERDALINSDQTVDVTAVLLYEALTAEIDAIRAELFARGHAVGGPRRE